MKKINKQMVEVVDALTEGINKALVSLLMDAVLDSIDVKSSEVITFKFKLVKDYCFDTESFDEIMGEVESATGWRVSFDNIKDNVMQLTLMNGVLDIYSKGWYPSYILSNFSPNKFNFDGVECCSMEGFLQSLKVKNQHKQKEICKLYGKHAKNTGKRKIWWKITGNVYWQGRRICRSSEEFKQLILRAYIEMFKQNHHFYVALSSIDSYSSTKGIKLVHTLGKKKKRQTILTEEEFISCLNYLRENIDNLITEGHKFVYDSSSLDLTYIKTKDLI